MDKRYQVFVSSTYDDLRVERAEVIQALLELDCMPAGMELFPATTEEQWSWIARVIEESDYYVVIVGGRYGSVHPTKEVSYTELEYRYAVDIGKPVIAFLHGSPAEIPAGKTEKNPELLERLLSFRAFCQQRLCKYWDNPADLGGKVSRSMTQLIKRHPAIGWIRADAVTSEHRLADIEMREELARLRLEINARTAVVDHQLASGDDPITISFHYETKAAKLNKSGIRYWVIGEPFWHDFELTWNQILRRLGALLLVDPLERELMQELNSYAMHHLPPNAHGVGEEKIVQTTRISHEGFNIIKTQLVALGLIELYSDAAARAVRWRATELGRRSVLTLTTVPKPQRGGRVKHPDDAVGIRRPRPKKRQEAAPIAPR